MTRESQRTCEDEARATIDNRGCAQRGRGGAAWEELEAPRVVERGSPAAKPRLQTGKQAIPTALLLGRWVRFSRRRASEVSCLNSPVEPMDFQLPSASTVAAPRSSPTSLRRCGVALSGIGVSSESGH